MNEEHGMYRENEKWVQFRALRYTEIDLLVTQKTGISLSERLPSSDGY
jgi:hypothetical protein